MEVDKEVIKLMTWCYQQGYRDATKILMDTQPNDEKMMALFEKKFNNVQK